MTREEAVAIAARYGWRPVRSDDSPEAMTRQHGLNFWFPDEFEHMICRASAVRPLSGRSRVALNDPDVIILVQETTRKSVHAKPLPLP